jgi:hypothetical protein
VALALQTIYLLVQSAIGTSAQGAEVDALEARITKEKKRLFAIVKDQIGSIQYEMMMDKSDQQDRISRYDATCEEDFKYIDYDKEFVACINDYVIQPFGKQLNQDLLELFSKRLDLGEVILKSLRDSANAR